MSESRPLLPVPSLLARLHHCPILTLHSQHQTVHTALMIEYSGLIRLCCHRGQALTVLWLLAPFDKKHQHRYW